MTEQELENIRRKVVLSTPGYVKYALKDLTDKTEEFIGKYGEKEYNRYLNYYTVKTAMLDNGIDQKTFAPNIAYLDDMINNRKDYTKKYGKTGYDYLYNTYKFKVNAELMNVGRTLERIPNRFSYSALQKYYPDIAKQYSYNPSDYEDKVRKQFDYLPKSFNAGKYAQELTLPEGQAWPDVWDAESTNKVLSEWYAKEKTKDLPENFFTNIMRRNGVSETKIAQYKISQYNALPEKEKTRGYEIAKQYNLTIDDVQAQELGGLDNFITTTANDPAKKQAAEQYAQQTYGPDYKRIPITFSAGLLGLPVTTYLDASTGLVENQQFLGIDNANIKEINNATSTLMLQKSLGYTDDQLDQNSLNVLNDKGLTQIIDIIKNRKQGDYFVVTDDAKTSIEKGMALQAGQDKTINDGLDKANTIYIDISGRPDYEKVLAAPPPLEWNDAFGWLGIESGIKTEWNYIFDPTPEQFYTTVRTAYDCLNNLKEPISTEEMDKALKDGMIAQETYDTWKKGNDEAVSLYKQEKEKWGGFDFLTQDMVDTVTYLYAEYKKTGDNTKLMEYYNNIRPLMRDAQYTAFKGGMQDIVNKYGAAGTAITGLVSAGDYFLSGGAYIYNAYNAANGLPTDPTAGVLQIARAAQELPDIAVSNIKDPTAKWLTKTMITMAPQLGAYIVNPSLGLFASAAATAGRDVTEQIRMGATPWDANVHATVMAGIDYLTNKAMLRGFSAVMKGNMFNLPSGFIGNLEKFAINAIKTFGVGAFVTAQKVALENIADMVLAGDKSRYAALVNQHLQEGMPLSNAQAAAAFESIVTQPLDRSIEGGLMAAAFSIYGTYKNNANLKANQALEVTGTGKAGYDPYAKTDFRPSELEAGTPGLPDATRLPSLPGTTSIPGVLESPGSYGAAATLKAAGMDAGIPEGILDNIDSEGEMGDNKEKGEYEGSGKIPWNSWQNYEKVTVNGQVYAKVGDRLYTKHAVDRMQPSGNRFGPYIYQAGGDYGRSVAPQFVEDVISSTKPVYQPITGNYEYVSGTVKIITDANGFVITIITYY